MYGLSMGNQPFFQSCVFSSLNCLQKLKEKSLEGSLPFFGARLFRVHDFPTVIATTFKIESLPGGKADGGNRES